MTVREVVIEKIEEEMKTIMDLQKQLDPTSEKYQKNDDALKAYADILAKFTQGQNADREFELKLKEFELKLQELELKKQEDAWRAELEERKLKSEMIKYIAGGSVLALLTFVTLKYEETGVITSKIFNTLFGAVVKKV